MILELILKICHLKSIQKSFCNGSCSPHKSKVLDHISYLNLVSHKYSKVYDDFIFMGEFNVAMSDKAMEIFFL